MAGASAKKTAKNAQSKSIVYGSISAIASFINLIFRIGFLQEGIFQSVVLALVSFLAYRMIRGALELGVGYSMWQDLFVINTAVQLLTLYSSWAWVLYLTVPGYGLFLFGGKLHAWIFTPREGENDGEVSNKKTKSLARK